MNIIRTYYIDIHSAETEQIYLYWIYSRFDTFVIICVVNPLVNHFSCGNILVAAERGKAKRLNFKRSNSMSLILFHLRRNNEKCELLWLIRLTKGYT